MALSCIIFEINRDMVKIAIFFRTPSALDAPVRGFRRNIAIMFGVKKTRMVWLSDGETFDAMFSRFVIIPTCDRQADRQTDRHLATA